jgi:hypothetical protein
MAQSYSTSMSIRRLLGEIPWQKIAMALAIAGLIAWSVGFLAGLVVQIVASYW